MLKVKELKYSKKFETGVKYEMEEIGLVCEGDEDTDAVETLGEMKAAVHAAHDAQATKPGLEDAPKSATGKKSSPKVKPETEEQEEEVINEDEVVNDEEVVIVEEEVVEDKPKTTKKAAKSKAAAYDNTDDLHKSLFGKIVTKAFGANWSKDAKKKDAAKSASLKLKGDDFLDKDGDVLPDFEKTLIRILKTGKR